MIDDKDLLLLQALQDDAAQKLESLAKMIRLAPSSVHDRLRRLAKLGVIRQWTIRVDHAALGVDLVAFIGVTASRPCADLIGLLSTFPEIEECHSVAGALSLLLKVRVAKTSDLMDVTERLRSLPGVEGTETTVVLKSQIERAARLTINPMKRSAKS